MRRKYFGLAIAALATIGPMQAWGGDREIAEQIIQRLKTNRDSGALKDFTLDMKVDNGVVLFRGNVSQEAQKEVVLRAADGILGIAKIVDEVKVTSAAAETQTAKLETSTQVGDETASSIRQAVGQEVGAFSFRNALASTPIEERGQIAPVSNVEPANDAEVVAAVVSALSQAKESGQLRGFGVDVKSHNGILELSGRAARLLSAMRSSTSLKTYPVSRVFVRRSPSQREHQTCPVCLNHHRCRTSAAHWNPLLWTQFATQDVVERLPQWPRAQ